MDALAGKLPQRAYQFVSELVEMSSAKRWLPDKTFGCFCKTDNRCEVFSACSSLIFVTATEMQGVRL